MIKFLCQCKEKRIFPRQRIAFSHTWRLNNSENKLLRKMTNLNKHELSRIDKVQAFLLVRFSVWEKTNFSVSVPQSCLSNHWVTKRCTYQCLGVHYVWYFILMLLRLGRSAQWPVTLKHTQKNLFVTIVTFD